MIKIHNKNRKSKHNYEFLEKYKVGLVLTGSEVKSIKSNHISLKESYITIDNNEAFLKQAHIARLHTSSRDHEEVRNIKLLLNRKEINTLKKEIDKKGLTIVPYIIYTEKHLLKLDIYLAKGKSNYDKREALKQKDLDRKANDYV
jgi:SsrA-binding protein